VSGKVGRANLLPEPLVDDDGRGEPVVVSLGEPRSLEQAQAVHCAEARVNGLALNVNDSGARQLNPSVHIAAVRREVHSVAIDGVCESGVDGLDVAGAAVDRVRIDVYRRRTPAAALHLLDLRLLCNLAESYHRRDRGHGDSDADEAEKHPSSMDAQLGPCFENRAPQVGKSAAHALASLASTRSPIGPSTPLSRR